MAKKPSKQSSDIPTRVGAGGEWHQTATDPDRALTTNQGTVVSDDQNSLKSGRRGPTLLEDFVMREKITHFDHERIPERIVHARGSAAHGYFEPYPGAGKYSKAAFLQNPRIRTPVFARFSTVAGGAGSVDLPRDVRGFAVKFYTEAGVFDLVGNNIPVFFIQDAMKFPDLIHAVKMEPDRGYPQAASAHDTFWDFISLMPESMHMIMWAMSDRAIPRSLRMMEGFGIHTFRFIDAKDRSTFVKFHWRPRLGTSAVLWDEALKISGADPDFHRRDLFESIAAGDFPEWELSVQMFDQAQADKLPFDVLDPTKLIPEEIIPLTPIGKMVLNRNPDNFFAETEQVAFHPGHVVPGIDFTDDPLLQGRLFSYTDTQLSRLGGPNFHQLPINRPKCPFQNFQRDAVAQMEVPTGRVSYEPNSLAPDAPREHPEAGFRTHPATDSGDKVRVRSETFNDHYSQARLFFRSMTEPEQMHMINAFTFELSKVATPAIRTRMLGHLQIVDASLAKQVAANMGLEGQADKIKPARPPIDMEPSPALSMVAKFEPTFAGRKLGILVTDGCDGARVEKLRKAAKKEGAQVDIIAPRIAGVKTKQGDMLPADHALAGAPSILFDAVALVVSDAGAAALCGDPNALNFVRDAYTHLKCIGHTPAAASLLDKADVMADEAVVDLAAGSGVGAFFDCARNGRYWARADAF